MVNMAIVMLRFAAKCHSLILLHLLHLMSGYNSDSRTDMPWLRHEPFLVTIE